jgi:uncharacterized double-CXXCG motif protein
VDLRHLPERDFQSLAKAHLERDFSEYERLCRLVQPLLPPGQRPWPGTGLGPMVGTAFGNFGAFYMPYSWRLMAQRSTVEKLQAEGVRGVQGFVPQLRWRQKRPPELLDIQVEPQGQLHPECLPPEHRTPCPKCGRWGFRIPDDMLLDKSTVPGHTDIFRIGNALTRIVVTERFREVVERLGLDGVLFRELAAR